ncbi:MAG: DNA replication/repair protein RecF [Elusimicrobiota bacterium]
MFLKKLHIQNFRNHSSFIAEFRPGINIITGKNGAGKTNILEAIFFLSTSASPRASSYADMMKKGRNYFFIRAGIIEGEKKYTLTAGYASEKGFVAKLNGNRLNRRKLLEIFPVVLFSPEDIDIFKGPPGGMRRLFNINIAQTNNAYIENLLKFRRLLKERNRILKARRPGKAKDLRAWTSTLVKYAKRIHAMRRDYVGKANKEIQEELKKAGLPLWVKKFEFTEI